MKYPRHYNVGLTQKKNENKKKSIKLVKQETTQTLPMISESEKI